MTKEEAKAYHTAKVQKESKNWLDLWGVKTAIHNFPDDIASILLMPFFRTYSSEERKKGIRIGAKFYTQKVLEERSEEHTSELQSLMRISYAVFCLKKQNQQSKTVTC